MAFDILVVDDESDICDLVCGILSDEGYRTYAVSTSLDALTFIKTRQPSLVILDVWLGDGLRDGIKILEIIKQDYPFVPVVMMSGHGTVETAVKAIKLGAYDFIEKPFQTEKLLITVERALEAAQLKRENSAFKAAFSCSLIGSHPGILKAKQILEETAATSSRIFLHGPVGCDRAEIARYIHEKSSQSQGPFLLLNCASLPAQKADSELFGVDVIEQNNSQSRKIGLLEQANGGTLFIDEVSLLSESAQIRLARFLHTGKFSRMGGNQSISSDVRLICGSSLDGQTFLQLPSFRPDLYYRLSVILVTIPPLPERNQDIPLLIKHFMSSFSAFGGGSKVFSREALSILESYSWPGDIQQFKNVLEWILIMNADPRKALIEIEDLPPEIIQGNTFVKDQGAKSAQIIAMPIKEAREAFEKDYLLSQLRRFNGHISQTARFIGMDRASLHRKLKSIGLTGESDPLIQNKK